MNPVYLSICAIIRNEEDYLAEWIEFHRLVGVERFYLYDDGSIDATVQVAQKHDRGDVVLQSWKGDPAWECPANVDFRATHQVQAFNRFIAEHREETNWCAFIDPDEYLYHAEIDDIRDPLFEELDAPGFSQALFVNWLIFGSNGHEQKPPGLTIEAYTKRARCGDPRPTGGHGKIIARMHAIDYFGPHGSHNAVLKHGHAINERGQIVLAAVSPTPSADAWRLNHYYHRSAAEARARVQAVDNNAIPGFQKTSQRMRKHDLNDVEDREILRFLPRLMEAM